MDSSTNASRKSDQELIQEALAGRLASLGAVFDRYQPRLLKILELRMDRRLQGRIDPTDVLQELFLAVQEKFSVHFVRSQLPIFLWLRLELAQKLSDLHRYHIGAQRRSVGQEVSLHRGAMPEVSSVSLAEHLLGRLTTPSAAFTRVELKLRVQDALNQMEANDREILVLRHFEELTNSEAAQLLGISPTAACNRYVRALKRMQGVLTQVNDGLTGLLP